MTPERHAQVQQIFDRAIDLAEPSRREYLDEACRGDVELRAQLERLIEAADETITIPGGAPPPVRQSVKHCPNCGRCYDGPTLVCPQDGASLVQALSGSMLIDGKYLLERQLGSGGMGAVYLVTHVGLQKQFALKLIIASESISEPLRHAFEEEAHALGQLKHPNIVDVTDYGIDPRGEGIPYLVMEYLEGQTLRQLMEKHGSLPLPDALPCLRAFANAIDAAHASAIVHGDLKPSNFFLSQRDGRTVPKIVDFGLARLGAPFDPSQSTASVPGNEERTDSGPKLRGTPPYIAPELFAGAAASPASDRFAFGVTIYEVLTGALPFGRNLFEVRERLLHPPSPISVCKPRVPRELDDPVAALLNPAPESRPASAVAALSSIESAWILAEQRNWRAREVPRRLALASAVSVAAILLGMGLAQLRVARILESRTIDSRFAAAPKRAPDRRLLMVAVDDATLAKRPHPLADVSWADEFGDMVGRIFDAGANAVAIDLLLPAGWSSSKQFSRLVESRADRLTLSKLSTPTDGVIGTECIGRLTAYLIGAQRYADLFAFVNLDQDEDGRIRRALMQYVDRDGGRQPSFGMRAALVSGLLSQNRQPFATAPIWIDYSTRLEEIPRISWNQLEDQLAHSPARFRGRLVMIGADFSGSGDAHRIPAVSAASLVSGLVVHALIANTIASPFPITDERIAPIFLSASGCFAVLAIALVFPHHSLYRAAAAALMCLFAAAAFIVFAYWRLVIAVVGPEIALLLSAAAAWFFKNRLAPYPVEVLLNEV